MIMYQRCVSIFYELTWSEDLVLTLSLFPNFDAVICTCCGFALAGRTEPCSILSGGAKLPRLLTVLVSEIDSDKLTYSKVLATEDSVSLAACCSHRAYLTRSGYRCTKCVNQMVYPVQCVIPNRLGGYLHGFQGYFKDAHW